MAQTFEGAVTGDITGDLTGDIKSSNGTKILENGTDGTFTGVFSKRLAQSVGCHSTVLPILILLASTRQETKTQAESTALSLSGDVVGTANFDGTAGISISTAIQANSVALGTDTTGNFMSDVAVTSGTGLSVSHSAGEGSTATFAGIDATNSVKGVASFASANFDVSSGAVSISAIDGGTY